MLCTQTKTYALKHVETTNTLLLVPPGPAHEVLPFFLVVLRLAAFPPSGLPLSMAAHRRSPGRHKKTGRGRTWTRTPVRRSTATGCCRSFERRALL